MKPNQKPNRSESGITLIALIVMIVILVILSVIVIRAITGSDGLISTTEAEAEEYNINSYKEQIEQKVRGTIITYSNRGKEFGLAEIAEELNEETLWVKSAVANINIGVTNDDIIVTTTDKYVYQVYYNDTYGVVFVEYIGKENKKEIPNIKAKFDKRDKVIVAEASESKKRSRKNRNNI